MDGSEGTIDRLKKKLSQYARSLLIALGWGTSVGAITLWAIFQGVLLPSIRGEYPPVGILSVDEVTAIFYLCILGVSILAGMILADFARSLGGFVLAYLLGFLIVFEALSAPGLSTAALNNLLLVTRNGLTLAAIDLTFRVLFLFPTLTMLFGGILGTALEERYF